MNVSVARKRTAMISVVGIAIGLALGEIAWHLLFFWSVQANVQGLQGGPNAGGLVDGVMYAPEKAHLICLVVGAALGGCLGGCLGHWSRRNKNVPLSAPETSIVSSWPPPPTSPT